MLFGKKNWEDQYDEDYAARADRRDRIKGSTLWIHLIGFGLIVGLLIGLAGLICGQYVLEKTLASLASPVGFVWLILIFLAYFSLYFRQGWSAIITIICWSLLSLFGNGYIANQMMYQIEKPYIGQTINELETMDVLFLLGGGTTTNLTGAAQAGTRGDRVLKAARVYHAGKAKLIVCTGMQLFKTDDADLHPHQEAAKILSDLQVPEQAIAMIRGYNTSEEMQLAAEFLKQQSMQNAKIGVLTSAWHLNRAGRLAKSNGLDPVLIPSDFRSRHFSSGPNLLIPTADSLSDTTSCIKEFLAYLVGR